MSLPCTQTYVPSCALLGMTPSLPYACTHTHILTRKLTWHSPMPVKPLFAEPHQAAQTAGSALRSSRRALRLCWHSRCLVCRAGPSPACEEFYSINCNETPTSHTGIIVVAFAGDPGTAFLFHRVEDRGLGAMLSGFNMTYLKAGKNSNRWATASTIGRTPQHTASGLAAAGRAALANINYTSSKKFKRVWC